MKCDWYFKEKYLVSRKVKYEETIKIRGADVQGVPLRY